MGHKEIRLAFGWAGGPYVRLEPRTVVKPAGLLDRQFGLRTWLVPHIYRSNAQIRFEWGLVEIHHIKGTG